MKELLAPVGSKEAFYAAISNGCDAIYLGLSKHNARAYADNFSLENIKQYIDFAHLRNVRVFVTLNTIVYDNELNEIYDIIDQLANLHVDAIIAQDLAVLNYAVSHYKSLEVHASTQMGIDDVEGAKLLKQLGVKRVVLARETPIEVVKDIKNKAHIEVETFIHGALCVSYSGNCFMSAAMGNRSGNRGRCAGCCRKNYTLIDLNNNQKIQSGYLLSMKDLNLSKQIKNMDFVDSFKIEGRMKENTYVAATTNIYRHLIDGGDVDIKLLHKIFNRTYTKGFIYHDDSSNITNISRPNNVGYLVGKVSKIHNNKIWLKLFDTVNKGDLLRIEDSGPQEDINLLVTKMLDPNFNIVDSSNKTVIIYTDKKVKLNSNVYKTKDALYNASLNLGDRQKEYKKLDFDFKIDIKLGEKILLKASYKNHVVYAKSDYIVAQSHKIAITNEDVIRQLDKLNDTPYQLGNIEIFLDDNVFVPNGVFNELRREVIEKLNASRLNLKVIKNKDKYDIIPQKHESHLPKISIEVSNQEQYDLVTNLGYKDVYFKNVVRRNNATYVTNFDNVLVGGLSSLSFYKNKNIKLVTDYSLNITNHLSVALLSSLGAERITLSNELNEEQINNLIRLYKETYQTHPNLEMIVYGRLTLMHSKYCPLKRLGMCGKCKDNNYALKDNFETFPLRFNDDCTINLLNSKTLNLLDDISNLKGINYYRLVFTTETKEEILKILDIAHKKINQNDTKKCFDGYKQTRGNFKKNYFKN